MRRERQKLWSDVAEATMLMVNGADVHALERCWAFLLSTRCISTHRTRTEELAKQLCVIHHAIATVSPSLANRDSRTELSQIQNIGQTQHTDNK